MYIHFVMLVIDNGAMLPHHRSLSVRNYGPTTVYTSSCHYPFVPLYDIHRYKKGRYENICFYKFRQARSSQSFGEQHSCWENKNHKWVYHLRFLRMNVNCLSDCNLFQKTNYIIYGVFNIFTIRFLIPELYNRKGSF